MNIDAPVRTQLGTCLLGLALAAASGVASAAGDAAPAELNVVLSQRFWSATWDQAVTDIAVSADGPNGVPALRASYLKNVSRRTIPITAIGLRYGPWNATVARFGTQRFDGNGIYADTEVRRDETDLSIGYQLMPGISVAAIRKTGRVSSFQSKAATELFGDAAQKGRATLAGLSGTAPIGEHLLVYGNLAYGPGKFFDAADGAASVKVRYAVSEFGFAYRHPLATGLLGIQAVSLQAGYRVQSIAYEGIVASDFEGLPVDVSVTSSKARSVTDGFILSLSLIF